MNHNLKPMDHQDWSTVVFRRKDQKTSGKVTVNEAQRRGLPVETYRKPQGGKNTQNVSTPNQQFRHFDKEEGPSPVKLVSLATGQKIAQARTAKEWSRKDLAIKLNVKEAVIAEHENGKAVYNGQLLQRMAQLLGVSLK